MDRAAGAFSFPFRPGARRAWLIGITLLILCPLGVVPLLGSPRPLSPTSTASPLPGPPPLLPLPPLLSVASLVALLFVVLTPPFLLLAATLVPPLPGLLAAVGVPFLLSGLSLVVASGFAALPWGILLLVLMPPATARFATSGSLRDLLDLPAAVGTVRRRFPTWNLVVVAIVTAWPIGLSGVGLALVGVIPGALYALLVSAHATATLADA